MKTKIINKTGNSIRDYILFEAISDESISKDDAMLQQARLGYPKEGYSFIDFKSEFLNGKYVATWACWANCD